MADAKTTLGEYMRLARSRPIMFLEFRSGGAEETIRWLDKQTRTPQEMKLRRFNMEGTDGPVQLSLPRDSSPATSLGIDKPLIKGQSYLVHVHNYQIEKGSAKATGSIHPLPEATP